MKWGLIQVKQAFSMFIQKRVSCLNRGACGRLFSSFSTIHPKVTIWTMFQQLWFFPFNTLRPRQNGRHFADDMFKCVFLNENVRFPIEISLKFVPKGSINNNPALFQIMAWRRPGDKPLSDPMMVNSLTHICVTRPQWVKICMPDTINMSVANCKQLFEK